MKLRWSFPPYPVGWVSRETLQGYIRGKDPISGATLLDEILLALTRPLTEAEKQYKAVKRPTWPRLLEPDTEDNLHRLFLESGWTDGLPIVLPTEERVAEMLTGTDRAPDEQVGMMSVTTHEERLRYTVEKVAVIAVMAGCRPEHFPVILALGASGRPSLPSSTTSFASMMVVNGPVRNEIGMNSGLGALSPVNYANSVIGRAWTLLSINFGDMRPGATFTASTGTTINYNNMCCAENEELSPWPPFHVRKGFKAGESIVSLFRGWNVVMGGAGPGQQMIQTMKGMSPFGGAFTFIMDPLVAKNLKKQGWDDPSKLAESLQDEIFASFKPPEPPGRPGPGERPAPPRRPFFPRRPDMINFIVVGGEMNPLYLCTDFSYFQSAPIDPWIPKAGIKKDPKPLRIPKPVMCKDGSCGIS
jgi:hypothetical protein